jgi:hypothetical protein
MRLNGVESPRKSAGWLAQAGETQADPLGRTSEISIPGHEDDFLIAELERGGKVNRVVAAKSEIFGVLVGATGQVLEGSPETPARTTGGARDGSPRAGA